MKRMKEGKGLLMVWTMLGESRVGVHLTPEDLGRLGVRFCDMDLRSPAFKAALWLLKEEARRRGVDVDLTGRLLVEAFERCDGVELYMTVLSGRPGGRLLTKRGGQTLLRAADSDAVKKAAALLPEGAETLFCGGAWYLIAPDVPEENLRAATEFAVPLPDPGGVLAAVLREHGEPAAVGDVGYGGSD